MEVLGRSFEVDSHWLNRLVRVRWTSMGTRSASTDFGAESRRTSLS